MPPRAKKLPPGPGSKRGGRGGRGAGRAKAPAPAPSEVEEPFKVEEAPVMEVKPGIRFEEVEEANTTPQEEVKMENEAEIKTAGNRVVSVKKDNDLKQSVDEFEKSERLDLEDNDPEYEPGEYASVDYDEKGIEHEDARGKPKELEEDHLEEEDIVEEEIEDVQEELEGEDNDGHDVEEHAEENDEHDIEEHAELVDNAEEADHHELVKDRRKRKEFEIFVGGLDKDATEDDLRQVFAEVGVVTEVRLMMNPQTKKNKGFAFLCFATVEQAKRACSELKNPVVHGKQCGVTPSQDSDTLFLGNICKTWTKEALRQKLKRYGVENIEDLTLVKDSNNDGMNRGFAFLEFFSRSDAMDAFKWLQKRDVVFGVDRPAKVAFADSFIDPGDEIMAQVKTVFVDGLPASWDGDQVRELLKAYGDIEKVELARNMPSAKRKDFGFVTFNSHDAAVTCAKSINNEELGEGDSKAKVRARLSRPLQRGKGKHIARRDYRSERGPARSIRSPWSCSVSHSIPVRGTRGVPPRMPPVNDHGFRRPAGYRDRRPVMEFHLGPDQCLLLEGPTKEDHLLHIPRVARQGAMIVLKNFHQGAELLQNIVLEFLLIDAHHIRRSIPLVDLDILICLEFLLVQWQEGIMLIMVMGKDTKGHLQLTMKVVAGNTIWYLGRSVHTLLWMMSPRVIQRQGYTSLVLVWITNLVAVLLNMGILMVIDLEDRM